MIGGRCRTRLKGMGPVFTFFVVVVIVVKLIVKVTIIVTKLVAFGHLGEYISQTCF